MPHRCVKCEQVYEEPPVTEGCACGSKVFLFVRKDHVSLREHVRNGIPGKYELDIPALLNVPVRVVAMQEPEEGKYVIDLEAALHKQ